MMKAFKDLNIKTKLIIIFVFIKVIPVILISMIALFGINELYTFLNTNTLAIKKTAQEVVTSTATIAVEDSILALDKKSQNSLEILSTQIAQAVANFLYERDHDLLFLSQSKPNPEMYQTFLETKKRYIMDVDTQKYVYDEHEKKWVYQTQNELETYFNEAKLPDNKREFQRIDPKPFQSKAIPLYKEITFLDLKGNEQIKISSLSPNKVNVAQKSNTYLKAENYFKHLSSLKKNEIYVSEVIGKYIPSRIIGTFSPETAQKAGIAFEPENHAYAGKENPKGKRFEGIIRFVTPVYEGDKKIGYLSLALDHRHIMEFTDTVDPLAYSKTDIPDAGEGNYAFMWDYKGRNISHARDYFIVGFDEKSGEYATPWLSQDLTNAFNESNVSNIHTFLKSYPLFHEQSLEKKPNLEQIKKGELGLDCRYLNFAPQCQGWMQLTENSDLGSFIIFWSNVWKLTTAATIPYYTGQYGSTPRGFGFVTIGANVDEFHKAANATKENLEGIVQNKLGEIDTMMTQAEEETSKHVKSVMDELTYSTLLLIFFMILIAMWLSNHLRKRLDALLKGSNEFAKNNLTYHINVESNDEIGILANAFNQMAHSLKGYMDTVMTLNASLEKKVQERTSELLLLNQTIQEQLDIKKEQEEKLEIFAKIFSNTIEGIAITNLEGIVLQINDAFSAMTHYAPHEVLGQDIRLLRSYKHPDSLYKEIWDTVFSNTAWQGELWNKRKDGTLYPALLIIHPILNREGHISYIVFIQHDISVLKHNEEKLHQQAYYDPLTKLANRTLAYDRLQHAITNAKSRRRLVSVLFLDLDKFKNINDTLGHDIGDLLLIEVAKRIQALCSQSDTVCRLGGDEFLVILEDITHYETAISVAKGIIAALSQPFYLEGRTISTSTSIGITYYPNDGDTMKTLLKNADIAMYRSKTNGRGSYEIFTTALSDFIKESVKLEERLKKAVEKHEFFMHYQPIYDLQKKEIIGLEALMRWNYKGVTYFPDTFLSVMEETKMIAEASSNLFISVFHFIKKLNEALGRELFVSINISPVQFSVAPFQESLIHALEASTLRAQLVCLEVTESLFLENIEEVSQKLAALKTYGFCIALDDFGSGYSSLQYLKVLPLNKLKLDRIFVQDLPDSQSDIAITQSVLALGKNFNVNVIVEGVETEEQCKFLEQIGCRYIQGYLISKPMPEENVLEFLREKEH
ncbi:EAL domain-containing protein [Sulfurospirillum deleyianum]|uniref:Diguanylate cyclase n=1 Tax=Sulfurospirillum deleyianum (strain ATCC 51133 / DSM 6946 / 5175) TaxID=525898 RepID=D1B535_SULD5|nr:EAL domain-containing protein [Sulfurospirillum deleyianum]ACZ13205.1 diguanylate cyclase [Sulfurospirillum deleyianum DSM 6946]